jgi:predicted 3-demethylubiquinone-9 3-methyltransferase (glyoxalase superfamily)
MQSIVPFIWFDSAAEEAINFYVAVFPNSKIISLTRYSDEMTEMNGKILTGVFELDGQRFMAIDGGPQYKFTEAISFFINCETQEEVNYLWEKLSEGGEKGRCGWLKDQYGVSWQVVPTVLGEMLQDKKSEKVKSVMQAMLLMDKIEISILKEAYEEP